MSARRRKREQKRTLCLSSYVVVLSLLVSLASLGVAVRTCRLSDDANSIADAAKTEAETANALAARAFSVAHRPQLVIAPVKSSQTGKYVSQQVVDRQTAFVVGYELRNMGEGTASDITIGYRLELAPWSRPQPAFSMRPAPVIALAPGEGRVMLVEHVLDLATEDIAAWVSSTPDWHLLATIEVTYRWGETPDSVFTAQGVYALRETRADTLASEYLEQRGGGAASEAVGPQDLP